MIGELDFLSEWIPEAGLLAVICGSDQCSAQFFIRDNEIVPRKPI